jgi:hypothetical protein
MLPVPSYDNAIRTTRRQALKSRSKLGFMIMSSRIIHKKQTAILYFLPTCYTAESTTVILKGRSTFLKDTVHYRERVEIG